MRSMIHEAITRAGIGSGLLSAAAWQFNYGSLQVALGAAALVCTAISSMILVVLRHRRANWAEWIDTGKNEVMGLTGTVNRLVQEVDRLTAANIALHKQLAEAHRQYAVDQSHQGDKTDGGTRSETPGVAGGAAR